MCSEILFLGNIALTFFVSLIANALDDNGININCLVFSSDTDAVLPTIISIVNSVSLLSLAEN